MRRALRDTGWAAGLGAGVVAARYLFVAQQLYLTDWRVPDRSGRAALTFDDGPHPRTTPGVLEDLADAGVSATFFVLGERAARHPRLVKDIAGAGHEVAVHGWRHRNTAWQTGRTIRRELRDAVAAVADAAGTAPRLYRPPYGVLAPAAARAAAGLGLRPYLWSAWASDWRVRPADAVFADLWAGLEPGAVLLLHDGEGAGGQDGAVAAMRPDLRRLLTAAARARFSLEPLGSLLSTAVDA